LGIGRAQGTPGLLVHTANRVPHGSVKKSTKNAFLGGFGQPGGANL